MFSKFNIKRKVIDYEFKKIANFRFGLYVGMDA